MLVEPVRLVAPSGPCPDRARFTAADGARALSTHADLSVGHRIGSA